jgi:methylphosphotriester-DNA--protein-cysteine methyltransferase
MKPSLRELGFFILKEIVVGKSKTHCKRGHAFTSENTYLNGKGVRPCRDCKLMRAQRVREQEKKRARAAMNFLLHQFLDMQITNAKSVETKGENKHSIHGGFKQIWHPGWVHDGLLAAPFLPGALP